MDKWVCKEDNHQSVSDMIAEVFGEHVRAVAMVWGEHQSTPVWNINLAGSAPQVGQTLQETIRNLNAKLEQYDVDYEAFDLRGLKIWLPHNRIKSRIQFSIRRKVSWGDIVVETP